MDDTAAYRRAAFARYYRDPDIELPPRFGRREYGFLFFDRDGMQRHTGFPRTDDLFSLLSDRVPQHCYYSSAYYETPGAGSMAGKGWMGADLIFDLDADHLDAPQGTPYPVLLEMCRDEAVKLVEDFLMRDFGFGVDDMEFAFSGGRGYHIHVRDPRVLELGSDARREIVDYIVGTGLDLEGFFDERAIDKQRFGAQVQVDRTYVMPRPDEPGWRGRVARGVVAFLEDLVEMDADEARDRLLGIPMVGPAKADAILEKLNAERLDRIRDGFADQFPEIKPLLLEAKRQASVDVRGETDEPVTTDTKRLIRLQGSLHGGSGLKVRRLTLDEMRTFDPLTDAVVFGDDPVRVRGLRDAKLGMKGELYEVEEGIERDLPECAAILAGGIHMAKILDPPRPP